MESPEGVSRRPAPGAADHSLPTDNVRRIAKLEEQQLQARSAGERVAGAVSRAAGTSAFAIAHLVWFTVWLLANSGLLRGLEPFDPFSFSLLTLIVSLEAIFLSIWILISQNQMTRQAERRAHLDLQINLLAEQESTATLRIVQSIALHLGVDPDACRLDADVSLADETDLERLASRIDESVPEVPRPVGSCGGAYRPGREPAAMTPGN
jgi:uncharacterized membrane protein